MLVWWGIRVIPVVCEPMKRRKSIKCKTISPQVLFICLCIGVYVCAILLIPIDYGPTMKVKCLKIWLLWGWLWILRVGASKRRRHLKVHLIVVSIYLFFFLLECMFDAKSCNLSFLSIKRLSWEVWRCPKGAFGCCKCFMFFAWMYVWCNFRGI